MFKTYRRGAARLAAAGIATGLLAAGVMAGAGAAVAAPNDGTTPSATGATAVLGGIEKDKADQAVVNPGAKDEYDVTAGLFSMAVTGGGTIETYCIDFNHHTVDKATYNEVTWDNSTLKDNKDAGKIAWILNNSYPKVDVAGVTDTLKAAGVTLDHPLTPGLAAAGTQVAIWHLSDPGVNVQAKDSDAKALAEYLDSHAQTLEEPKPSVTLDPPAVSGKSGDRLGPVTVHTTADAVDVKLGADAPAGVKIVDKDGKAISGPVKNGTALYFDVPAGTADGTAPVTVAATTEISVGRAFSATDTSSQSQILAGSQSTTVTAAATLSWAKKGPIPALSAQVVCAKNGVDVTAANQGDEDFTFELEGKSYTVAPGKSQTVTVPVQEDQKYKIDITLPNDQVKTFEGVLDCKTATTPGPTPTATPTNAPSPATSGSTTGGTDLAETGSSSATPMIAGIAIALVVLGGAAAFFFRRKKNTPTA
ncbi:LAETG motif-containing sortase-dependent surface protein [Streptomyces sp. NPDC088197]|uniref:LAETG motif-containing sortase-dependent surface protein n=1 Tax=unclassified Streptomyces TaxID=2593676 RepID=UPI00381EC182